MNINDWKKIYKSLKIIMPSDSEKSYEHDKRNYNMFQEETGLSIPSDYLRFMEVFGPGVLAMEFQMHAVHSKNKFDIRKLNEIYFKQRDQGIREVSNDDPLAIDYSYLDYLFFCRTTIGNHLVGWHLEDVNKGETDNCDIYIVFREGNISKVSKTIEHFVTEVCLGDKYFTVYDNIWAWGDDVSRKVFEPYATVMQ